MFTGVGIVRERVRVYRRCFDQVADQVVLTVGVRGGFKAFVDLVLAVFDQLLCRALMRRKAPQRPSSCRTTRRSLRSPRCRSNQGSSWDERHLVLVPTWS